MASGAAARFTVYTLANCATCRKTVKWLRARAIAFDEKPIRETPPTLTELRAMLAHQRGEVQRLFNTAGLEYRAMGLKEKLPRLDESEALTLLASNGRLVKRPFLTGPGLGLVGFDASAWSAALAGTGETKPAGSKS